MTHEQEKQALNPMERAELCVAGMAHDSFYHDLDSLDREVLTAYIERAIIDDRGRASGQQGVENMKPAMERYKEEHSKHSPGWKDNCPYCNPYEAKHRELAASPQITSSAEKTIADNLRSSAVSPVEIEIASPAAQPSDSAEEGGLEEACRIVLGRHPDLNEKEYRVARALLHRVQQEKLLPVEPSNSDART